MARQGNPVRELRAGGEAPERDAAVEVLVRRERERAVEEERRRLALALHDGVGQGLAALELRLAEAEELSSGSPAALAIQRARALGRHLFDELRELSHSLRPPVLELGLAAALRQLAEEMTTTALFVGFQGDQQALLDLAPGDALQLFRIAQAALGNVARHSQATSVTITLERRDSVVSLIIEDDGRGIPPGREASSEGLGLSGMRERALLIGATFELLSSPLLGTRIQVQLA